MGEPSVLEETKKIITLNEEIKTVGYVYPIGLLVLSIVVLVVIIMLIIQFAVRNNVFCPNAEMCILDKSRLPSIHH